MKLNLNSALIITIVLLLLTVGGTYYYFQKKNNDTLLELKSEKLRGDKLVQATDRQGNIIKGQASKLLADSLEKKHLRRIFEELGIDEDNPVLAEKIVFVPRDTITIIKEITKTDTTISFTDYYPEKENFFVKHITNLDTRDTTATGEFDFNPITLKLGINQQKDGTYKVTTKLPSFFDITSIDVQSIPMDNLEKKDNFGILIGTDYVKDLDTEKNFLDANIYLRVKKFYIGGGFRTDNTVKGGIKFEF